MVREGGGPGDASWSLEREESSSLSGVVPVGN